jgi:hypothetical protein
MGTAIARHLRVAMGRIVSRKNTNNQELAVTRAARSTVERLESRQLMTVFYVSPWGNDWGAGTSKSTPWKTIDRVNRQWIKPGDKVMFQGSNTYHGSIKIDWNEGGNDWAPVTIGSYGGTRATINSGNQSAVNVDQAGGVRVEHLIVRGSGMYNNSANGIHFHVNWNNRPLSNIQVVNVDAAGYGGYNVKVEAPGYNSSYSNVRIVDSNLHDSREGGIWINGWANRVNKNVYIGNVQAYNHPGTGSKTKVTGSGIFIADVDGAIVERSVAYNNGSQGKAPVGIWAAGSNRVTFQYNESHHNMTNTVTDGGGFDFDWDMTNSTMQYNYSHDNQGPGYLVCGDTHKSDNNTIRYNISQNDSRKNGRGAIQIYGNATNLKIYNNVVHMNNTWDWNSAAFTATNEGAAGTSMSNIDVRNNVFITTGGMQLARVGGAFAWGWNNKFIGNAYHASGAGFKMNWGGETIWSIDQFRWKGQEKEWGGNVGYFGDPKLKNAGWAPTLNNAWALSSLWQYQPQWNSPLINKGVWPNNTLSGGTSDFYGSWLPKSGKYDIGVSESA